MLSLLAVTAFCLVAGFLSPPSSQAITLGFDPASQYRYVGESFNVDIVISNLGGEIVSAFDLNVGYDPAMLAAADAIFGSFLNGGDSSMSFQGKVIAPGVVNLAELSILSDADLASLQPDSFILASLSFKTVAEGTSKLTFLPGIFGIDVKGTNAQILGLDPTDGDVTVGPAAIPEPATIILLSSGLAALAFRRFRR